MKTWREHRRGRIAGAVPEAKLVAVLRDPVDRAYSNWAHLWADGLEPVADFVTACGLEDGRQAAGWAPFWRYLGTGMYGEQLEHLLTVFRPEQLHLIRYKDLVDAPAATLDGVCRFLGVDSGVLTEIPSQNVGTYVPPSAVNRYLRSAFRVGSELGRHFPPQVWRKASIPLLWAIQRSPEHRPELQPEQRARLVGHFVDDVHRLERLTGWSLGDWLSYREGGTYSVRAGRGRRRAG